MWIQSKKCRTGSRSASGSANECGSGSRSRFTTLKTDRFSASDPDLDLAKKADQCRSGSGYVTLGLFTVFSVLCTVYYAMCNVLA